jgi:hypothetical protein
MAIDVSESFSSDNFYLEFALEKLALCKNYNRLIDNKGEAFAVRVFAIW